MATPQPALSIAVKPLPPRQRQPKPQDAAALGFGDVFTDHMFTMRWNAARGWHEPRVEPFAPLALSPAAMVLHYAQTVFEGLKAYRAPSRSVNLFRPWDNAARFDRSAQRLTLPVPPEGAFLQALEALLAVEREWVPGAPGASLYLRPTLVATEPHLGVRPAHEALFFVIASPVGPYYAEGFAPVKITVSEHYVRAAPGGLGAAKTGANYAASLLAAQEAHAAGYSQVLWLDALEHRWVEEVGSMNILFKIGGTVVSPPPRDTILNGVTVRAVLELLRHWGVPVEQRPIAIDEVLQAHADGTLEEVFGAGTAAVISPVGTLEHRGRVCTIADGGTGPVALRLFEELTAIQTGRQPDPFGWVHEAVPAPGAAAGAALAAAVPRARG